MSTASRARCRIAISVLVCLAGLVVSLAAERLARAAERPAAASAPAAPTLPAGATPLAPALAARLKDLRQATEEYRGLHFQREVPAVGLGGRALRRVTAQEFAEELPPERMRSLAAALKAFGFVPETMDVGRYYPELVASQQAAFYDPDRKYLAVVELGDWGKAVGLARRAEEAVLVHELTHALDDQSFDLGRLGKTLPLSDVGAALLGLIEGDATVTMFDYLMQARVEELPAFGDSMTGLMRDPGALASLSPDMPGSKEMAAAPAWFRDTLLFSYFQGFAFCLDVRRQGGQKLLDYAFAHDPPRSSEQLLHPEKWYGKRDDPAVIAWPDLAAELPGSVKTAEGDLGEEGVAILLRQGGKERERAATAAAGWGGDRFAVYDRDRKGGRRLLLWITDWDTEADAAEFQAAVTALGTDWTAARPTPSRVVVIRTLGGDLPAPERAILEAKLAAVKADKPANRSLDFAALGIERKKPPESGKTDEKLR